MTGVFGFDQASETVQEYLQRLDAALNAVRGAGWCILPQDLPGKKSNLLQAFLFCLHFAAACGVFEHL